MTGWPLVLSLTRILLAGPLIAAVHRGAMVVSAAVVATAAVTDVLDGWAARRQRIDSAAGGWLDVGADMTVTLAGLAAGVSVGMFGPWIVAVVVLMAVQFLATARRGKVVYDPVGRYFGAALFTMLIVAFLFPGPRVWFGLQVGIAALAVVSFASRMAWLIRRQAPNAPL